jgi:anthranilate synthase/aminodeoxychorismate synthase-like glutamine amidotransferase
MILIVDNYDSFVYNLAQYIGELGWEPMVFRNDRIGLADIEQLSPTHIVMSPGPGTPLDAGISNDVVRHFGGRIPILGVCLGHQCIGYAYGGKVARGSPFHGKTSLIYHDGKTIYQGLASPFPATRYHSLIVEPDSLPPCLEISARTPEGVVMGIRHRSYAVEGIQFHPESILTEVGHDILSNFLTNVIAVRQSNATASPSSVIASEAKQSRPPGDCFGTHVPRSNNQN